MGKLLCKCSLCEQDVEKWILDKCFPCYQFQIEAPLRDKIIELETEVAYLKLDLEKSEQAKSQIYDVYRKTVQSMLEEKSFSYKVKQGLIGFYYFLYDIIFYLKIK